MKIQSLKSFAFDRVKRKPGDVFEVKDNQGKQLVRAKFATEVVEKPTVKTRAMKAEDVSPQVLPERLGDEPTPRRRYMRRDLQSED